MNAGLHTEYLLPDLSYIRDIISVTQAIFTMATIRFLEEVKKIKQYISTFLTYLSTTLEANFITK